MLQKGYDLRTSTIWVICSALMGEKFQDFVWFLENTQQICCNNHPWQAILHWLCKFKTNLLNHLVSIGVTLRKIMWFYSCSCSRVTLGLVIRSCDVEDCVLVVGHVEVSSSYWLKFPSSSQEMQSAVSRGFGVSCESALEVHGAIGEHQGEADEWVSSIQGILQKRGPIKVKNLEMILP